jgi:predicted transcriptional regulator of viral defense system
MYPEMNAWRHNLTMAGPSWEGILEVARTQGVVTPSDAKRLGLAAENLNKMAALGLLVKAGRGLYHHSEYEWTENHSYVEVAKATPSAVLCLLSALRFHEIGTQNPYEVWIAVPRKSRPPQKRTVSLQVVRMSPPQYEEGVENHTLEGVNVKVYALEKTVIDCLRLRHLVGHDVALEALKEGLAHRRLDINKLVYLSKRLRSYRLLMPYLEALAF